mgnify:FL=1
MARNQIIALVIVVLNSFSLLVLLALKDSGASGLIVGTYTIIMFIVLSTLVVKMITKQNSRKDNREQHL